eukprot:Plantae.Rhodophyta-Purpureofilum_apyrenoidigerum.ctg11623.p1 GENE.Plantae.Rhodophyta-Purpureofilum_apyrenoidigerum.ctg11623~~Plantae.Rhodophyta-Purpureofilum_apyrenoidigerum.ctg11623.p1  ORF type:complete len:473 (+),score=91.11 Plantae.Rhodophyta-Purpureofilum_apyrenoidigerum.ctg11623:79-1419(+)
MRMATQRPTLMSTLSNGMRVASETVNGSEIATIGVYVYTGTRFETPENNGVAHFLEHLIFKGTKNMSESQIELKAENLGMQVNAYTSREHTVFFARAMKKDVPTAVEYLADILQNSQLQTQAVHREKDVILREHHEVMQQIDETLFDYLHEVAYQNTPLANTILGTPENIKNMAPDALRAYINEHYKPHRMVVAGAGAVDHDQLTKLVDKNFGSIKKDTKAPAVMDLIKERPAYVTGSEVRITNDHMPSCHFAIAFESVGWTHPDSTAFLVFQAMLGMYERSQGLADVSNMRLPRSMALHADHCRSYSSFNCTYTDTGLFGVHAIADPPEIEDVCLNIMTELVRTTFKIDPEALERAKLHAKITALASLDKSSVIADEIGRQVLVYGRRMPISEFFARIDEVDVPKLKAIAENYIYDREIAVAAIGPIWALPDYQWLRRRTFWTTY